jgi:hypothetical protein
MNRLGASHALLVPVTQRTDGKLGLRVRVLPVGLQSGEPVRQHPAVDLWIEGGWHVRKAVPRAAGRGEQKLLVILVSASNRPSASGSTPRRDRDLFVPAFFDL